ncbi:transporter [Caulobacter sp. 17J65-9]|uniref:ATP-grasp domain-containing protein n=1 Tax=Caulobacter sp. 17J65-9 TaxID=2709382 RepID=UPI0013CC3FBF|nr:transporter [Caulobacter sp. 17J65-9]NEX93351.1 transporter [Caulobacter sp. 17J65-9]
MNRVAILTPNPADEAFHGRWREVFDRMVAAFGAEGVEVDGRTWTEAGELDDVALVLPMNVWGYHREYARWLGAVAAWADKGVRLANPASVLTWNSDKRYLGRLGEAGAPVVPSLYVDEVTPAAMADAAKAFGVDRLVAKPQISAGAWQTLLWSTGQGVEGGPDGAAILQPFLPSVGATGETSLFYFDGAFSHAVSKVAAEGDFRVQPDFGGAVTTVTPSADERAAAEAVLASVTEPLLYARVDLVRDLSGKPALIELELIEPDLYLGYAPDKGQAFARAVRRALDGASI